MDNIKKKYKVVNGTYYQPTTDDRVIEVLERCRKDGTRITVDYGDVETGKSWGEIYDVSGRVGRSGGSIKIPILLHNSRSIGGCGMLDHCILSIRESCYGGRVLY